MNSKIKKSLICLLLFVLFVHTFPAQTKNSPLIDSLLNTQKEFFASFIADAKKYKIQIIYTQINRDQNNKPTFVQHNYLLDSTNYFYCASLVKLPCSILALQKINELHVSELDKNTTMFTDSAASCHKKVTKDTSSYNGLPSVAQYIRRMLLVSDNLAFGRVYELLTPDYIHTELSKRGYPNVRIVHRFDGGCSGSTNLFTNPITFYDEKGGRLHALPAVQSTKSYPNPLGKVLIGNAWMNNAGKKFNEPKDFSTYNFMNLQNTNDILKNLVFMPYVAETKKFSIKDKDRNFLLKYLSMLPRESKRPRYNTKEYFDSYKKYFIYGDSKKEITNKDLRIFNIVGQSYGFMVDCAYIADFKTKTEFMLSAVIYTNDDGVINDGKYEYKTKALPYLSKLGKLFLEYEKKRKKKTLPNLEEFKEENLSK